MANLIEDGWLYLSNGSDVMELACREIKWDNVRMPTIDHYEGGFSIGYDTQKKYMIIKVSGILFKTKASFDTFNETLNEWHDTAPFTLKIQTLAAGTYEKLDGTNTTYTVLAPKGWSDLQKIEKGDGTVYEVGKLMLEEAGLRSA